MLETTLNHYNGNSLTVVPVSHFKCCEILALLRYGDSKLNVETSFSHIIPAFRDLSMQKVPISRDTDIRKPGISPRKPLGHPMQVHQHQVLPARCLTSL